MESSPTNLDPTIAPAASTAVPETVVRTGWIRRARTRIFHRRVLMVLALAAIMGVFLIWLPEQARIALTVGIFFNRQILILIALFTLVSMSLLWAAGQELDAWAFLFINVRAKHPRWLDGVMWLLTQVGNMGLAVAVAIVLYLVNMQRLAIEIVLGLISLWLVVETIKAITDRARPYTLLKDVRIIGWRALGRSFPSGHTAQAFFMMALLAHRLDLLMWAVIALYVIAALVGFTRMYVGAHYPRDVVAGALIGLVWTFVIMLASKYLYAG